MFSGNTTLQNPKFEATLNITILLFSKSKNPSLQYLYMYFFLHLNQHLAVSPLG